jgi:hypothetical protein
MITWVDIQLENGWKARPDSGGSSYAARAGITDDGSFIAIAGEIVHAPTTDPNPFDGNFVGNLPAVVKAPANSQDVPVVVTTQNGDKSVITSASLYVSNIDKSLKLYGLPLYSATVAFSALIPLA